METLTNVNDLLSSHSALDIWCLDRIYLNAYVPNLQVPGQVTMFMRNHLKFPIPSPAIMEKIGNKFRGAVKEYAESNGIPIIHFKKKDRQIDVMKPYFKKVTSEKVVAIGVSQEFQSVFTGTKSTKLNSGWVFNFQKADRRVTVYYFYIFDKEFGPSFIKICSYFPYPAKVWLNGHEWAKIQATKANIEFSALSNGFKASSDPLKLQQICNKLNDKHIQSYFNHWINVIPTPLTSCDQKAGYWWELSMRQIEVSRTIVFTREIYTREVFESIVENNLGIGRPDEVKFIFNRRIRTDTKSEFKTRVVTRGTDVTINFFYKHSRVKEYLKDSKALRIETVINSPDDIGVQRRLKNLPELVKKATLINDRLTLAQSVSQSCPIETSQWERISQPSFEEGQRTAAIRFGDKRVMALAGALCVALNTVFGFTNKSLCALVEKLLDKPYSTSQMTYDLRKLRLKGMIIKLEKSNKYTLTENGLRFAVTYTKLANRLLPQLLATNQFKPEHELSQAYKVIETAIDNFIKDARIKPAA